MISYSPRTTRMVKSYAPIVNGLTVALGIDKIETTPLYIQDKITKEFYPSDEFYVGKHHQDVDPRFLGQKSFRHINKELWDQRVKNYRNGFGWKTDEELLNPPATIENFLMGEDDE